MNVFASDPCPIKSAQNLADKHVVKMILETAQMLSTAAKIHGHESDLFYKPTHTNHPCTKFVTNNKAYRNWAIHHGMALANEYEFRYGKVHKSKKVIIAAYRLFIPEIDGNYKISNADIPLAMPDEFKSDDPFSSYRLYLNDKYSKWGNAKWTKRAPPDWLTR